MAHAAAGPARRRRRDRHRTAAQPRVPVHLQPECSASGAIDVTGLVGRLKRHRHTCVHLRDVCMFNGTLHPWGAGLSRDELRDARTPLWGAAYYAAKLRRGLGRVAALGRARAALSLRVVAASAFESGGGGDGGGVVLAPGCVELAASVGGAARRG